MAANALVRMLGGYGADEPLVEMLKAICEQKDVGAELVSMLDQFTVVGVRRSVERRLRGGGGPVHCW